MVTSANPVPLSQPAKRAEAIAASLTEITRAGLPNHIWKVFGEDGARTIRLVDSKTLETSTNEIDSTSYRAMAKMFDRYLPSAFERLDSHSAIRTNVARPQIKAPREGFTEDHVTALQRMAEGGHLSQALVSQIKAPTQKTPCL